MVALDFWLDNVMAYAATDRSPGQIPSAQLCGPVGQSQHGREAGGLIVDLPGAAIH